MPKKLKKSKGKSKGKAKGKGKKGKTKSKKGKKGRYLRMFLFFLSNLTSLDVFSKSGDGPTKESLLKESLATAKLWEARYTAVEESRKEYRQVCVTA